MQYIQQLLSRINLLYLCPFVQKILHLSLILCLVALTPMSAYAAGDSLTSSISLSFNSTKKFQLEAYEHFYAYYTVPSSYSRTKNTLSVTVSNLSNFSISVMNSDGSSISTTRKKNILYFKNNAFIAENRYFIKIHNQRNIRSSGSINIRYTTDTTASPKTSHKDATNIASSHKRHQQKSTNNSSSRNASRQKSTNNFSSRNASRQKPLITLLPEMPAGRKPLITLLPGMPAGRKPLRALLPGKEKRLLRIMRPPLPKNMYLPALLFPLLLQPYTIFGSRKELLSH